MTGPRMDVRLRLYRRLAPCPDDGCECLLWGGYVDADGYGCIRADGKVRKVHRVAWQLENGPVPDGLTIDHVKARGCRHRHCANVAHLEPVTNQENVLRGDTITARNAAKSECKRHHPFDPANTIAGPGNQRRCAACKRTRDRERRQRLRLEVAS